MIGLYHVKYEEWEKEKVKHKMNLIWWFPVWQFGHFYSYSALFLPNCFHLYNLIAPYA